MRQKAEVVVYFNVRSCPGLQRVIIGRDVKPKESLRICRKCKQKIDGAIKKVEAADRVFNWYGVKDSMIETLTSFTGKSYLPLLVCHYRLIFVKQIALNWCGWVVQLAKTGFKTGYSHVCAPKILEVPKEHAQRKSQATLRSSRGVTKPTTRQTRNANDFVNGKSHNHACFESRGYSLTHFQQVAWLEVDFDPAEKMVALW